MSDDGPDTKTTDDGVPTETADILVFNPLPWEREVAGPISPAVMNVRGRARDQTAGRHFQDRRADFGASKLLDSDNLSPFGGTENHFTLPPTMVPGYGFTVIDRADVEKVTNDDFDERLVVDTDRYRLTFDREQGGIMNWYDRACDCEWVDQEADDPLGGFVHEAVVNREHDSPRSLLYRYPDDANWAAEIMGVTDNERGWQSDWHAERTRPGRVLCHRVYDTPNGYDVYQRLDVRAVQSDVILRVHVPEDGPTLTVEAAWEMGVVTHPESTYLLFPFNLDDATARIDIGAQAMEPGTDQIDGTCHDYYTVQRWVDISDSDRGMTVGTPLNPMVQFGDFSFADDARGFTMERPQLLGWVTSSYWNTNYRAHQPGGVFARYHLTPHGKFVEAEAHRRGLEAENAQPLAQALGEPTAPEASLPTSGSLLDLPDLPVIVTQIRPDRDSPGVFRPTGEVYGADAIIIRLRNASDEPHTAQIGSGVVSIRTARRVGALGERLDNAAIPVEDDVVSLELGPRETETVRLCPEW